MRKLKLQMQITLDGFVAALDGTADWMTLPDEAGRKKVIEIAASSDTLLMGGQMACVAEFWQDVADNQPNNPMQPLGQLITNMRKIVFSSTLTAATSRNTELQIGDLATIVNALKNEPGKDLLVYGGASFVSSLISLNLIDEYYMIVNPVAIGNGMSIFKERKNLKLESSIAFTNGKVLNKYLTA